MQTAPEPPAPIKKHSAALLPVWWFLTLGVYWPFWLYRTYKEIRAHMPGATTITPGKAVGFLFLPIFDIYWFFRIVIDFPRAISRMQKSCYPQEEPLPAGAVSAMLAVGWVLSILGGYVHPAWWFAGQILVLTAIVSCQQAMNAHSENHARALRGQTIVAASGERSFARLIGARGEKIEWRRVAVLVLSLAVTQVSSFVAWVQLARPLYRASIAVGWWDLLGILVTVLATTGVAVVAFRDIKNYWLASSLAALMIAPLVALVDAVLGRGGDSLRVVVTNALGQAASAFFLLAFLSMFVHVARSAWAGLGLGMACGTGAGSGFFLLVVIHRSWTDYLGWEKLAADLILNGVQYGWGSFYYSAVYHGEFVMLMFVPPILALAKSVIFALAFWILTKFLVSPAEAKALP